MRRCDVGGNHCGVALCGRVDRGYADGHVHVLDDLADVDRVVVRHDRVDDDNDVQLDTGVSAMVIASSLREMSCWCLRH